MDDGFFAPAAREVVPNIYSLKKGIYHYRHMAKNNFREYFKEDLVKIKKYFYILRALLSIMWLEKYKQPAPIEFHKLRELISHNLVVNAEIEALLERKKISLEKEIAPAIKALNDFIESELERLEIVNVDQENSEGSIEELNDLFAKMLT